MEYETLTGDEVRDLVLKGKKPKRPVVNTEGGSRGDQAVIQSKTAAAAEKKKPRGGLAGLADKLGPRRGVKDDN